MIDLEFLCWWAHGLRSRLRRGGDDRGDVPGWVMVTVMTAILVVAIIGVFKGQLTKAITDALDSVSGSGSSGK